MTRVLIVNIHDTKSQLNGSNGEWTNSDDVVGSNVNDERKRMFREAETSKHKKDPGTSKKGMKRIDVGKELQNKNKNNKGKNDCKQNEKKAIKSTNCAVVTSENIEFVVEPDKFASYVKAFDSELVDNHRVNGKVSTIVNYSHPIIGDHLTNEMLAKDEFDMKSEVSKMKKYTDKDYKEYTTNKLNFEKEVLDQQSLEEKKRSLIEYGEGLYDLKAEELKMKHMFLCETKKLREDIADMQFREANILECGYEKVKEINLVEDKYSLYMPAIREFIADNFNDIDVRKVFPKTNEKLSPEIRSKLTVPLMNVALFVKEKEESFFQWIARKTLGLFYKTVEKGIDSYRTVDINMCDTNTSLFSSGRITSISDLDKMQRVMAHFRFLGFESQFVRDIFMGKNDFISHYGFTHYKFHRVHPALYQNVFRKHYGKKANINLLDQVCRDESEWLNYIQADVYHLTIACAMQASLALMHSTATALPKMEGLAAATA